MGNGPWPHSLRQRFPGSGSGADNDIVSGDVGQSAGGQCGNLTMVKQFVLFSCFY